MSKITYREMTPEELAQNKNCVDCWNKPKRLGGRIIKATHVRIINGECIGGKYQHTESLCTDCVTTVSIITSDKIVEV